MRFAWFSLCLLICGFATAQQGNPISPAQINWGCTPSAPFYNTITGSCQQGPGTGSASGTIGQVPYFSAPSLINGISINGAPFYAPGVGVTSWQNLADAQCTQNPFGSTQTACFPIGAWFSQYNSNNILAPVGGNFGPGSSEGNSWRILNGMALTIAKNAPGIATGLAVLNNCNATGDCQGLTSLLHFNGNMTAGGDQGPNGIYNSTVEYSTYWKCTVTTTTGTGDTEPACTTTTTNTPLEGGDVVDVSKGTYNGNLNITNINGVAENILGTNWFYLPVTGVTLPTSSAIGQLTASLPWSGTSSATELSATNVTVTLATNPNTSARNSFTTGWATLAGNFVERVYITAGSTVSGVQTVSFQYRHNQGQAFLFQGGIAGNVISLDQDLAYSGFRTTYKALGSWGGTDLIYGVEGGGCAHCTAVPDFGANAATETGAFHLYPYAELIQDLVNTAVTNTVSVQLEGNNVPFAVGDALENPHGELANGNGYFGAMTQNSPCISAGGCFGWTHQYGGKGFGGSSPYGGGGAGAFNNDNNSPLSAYYPGGGPMTPPHGTFWQGPWDDIATMQYGNPPNGALITVSGPYPTAATCTASLGSGYLYVTACSSGALVIGQTITGAGFTAGLAFHVTGLPAGCVYSCTTPGTYTTDNFQTIASETITAGPGKTCLIQGYDGAGFSICHEPTTNVWLFGTAAVSLPYISNSSPICQPTAALGLTTTNCSVPATELPAATATTQGAVIMPTGSSGNTLGTAATKSTTGSGAAIPTGPTTTTNTDLVEYTGTAGQQADSGIAAANVIQVSTLTTPPPIGGTTPNTGAFSTIKVGTGVALSYFETLTSNSTTPASVAASSCADTAFTFTGVVAGMNVTMPAPPSTQTANIAVGGATATATNTVTIRFCNPSVTAAAPVAGVYTIGVFK